MIDGKMFKSNRNVTEPQSWASRFPVAALAIQAVTVAVRAPVSVQYHKKNQDSRSGTQS